MFADLAVKRQIPPAMYLVMRSMEAKVTLPAPGLDISGNTSCVGVFLVGRRSGESSDLRCQNDLTNRRPAASPGCGGFPFAVHGAGGAGQGGLEVIRTVRLGPRQPSPQHPSAEPRSIA